MSKRNTHQRARAREMAHRDYLAGRNTQDNPFQPGIMEHRAWDRALQDLMRAGLALEDTCTAYGCDTSRWTKREPESVAVSEPWPGCL